MFSILLLVGLVVVGLQQFRNQAKIEALESRMIDLEHVHYELPSVPHARPYTGRRLLHD